MNNTFKLFIMIIAFILAFVAIGTFCYGMGEPPVVEGTFISITFTPWINITAIKPTHVKIKNTLGVVIVDEKLDADEFRVYSFEGVGVGSMLYVKSACALIVNPLTRNILIDERVQMNGDLFYDDKLHLKQLKDIYDIEQREKEKFGV
jgi:hypothetical protein